MVEHRRVEARGQGVVRPLIVWQFTDPGDRHVLTACETRPYRREDLDVEIFDRGGLIESIRAEVQGLGGDLRRWPSVHSDPFAGSGARCRGRAVTVLEVGEQSWGVHHAVVVASKPSIPPGQRKAKEVDSWPRATKIWVHVTPRPRNAATGSVHVVE
jgi:hypothetical protein